MEPDHDPTGLFDFDEALEAKLRLGALASLLLEGAHILCTDFALLQQNAAGRVLGAYVADLSSIASEMEVLDRRSALILNRA